MKKRVVSLLAVMALTVGMLAGCGSSSDSSADTKDAAADEGAEAETLQIPQREPQLQPP